MADPTIISSLTGIIPNPGNGHFLIRNLSAKYGTSGLSVHFDDETTAVAGTFNILIDGAYQAFSMVHGNVLSLDASMPWIEMDISGNDPAANFYFLLIPAQISGGGTAAETDPYFKAAMPTLATKVDLGDLVSVQDLAAGLSGMATSNDLNIAINAITDEVDAINTQIEELKSSGTGGGIGEAPTDGKQYARQDEGWTEVDLGSVNTAVTALQTALGTETTNRTAGDAATLAAANSYTDTAVAAVHIDGALIYRGSVADEAALSGVASPAIGDYYQTADTGFFYLYNGTSWIQTDGITDLTNYYNKTQVDAAVAAGAFPEAPLDGNQYARQNAAWAKVTTATGGITDAPEDDASYVRKNAGWSALDLSSYQTKVEDAAAIETAKQEAIDAAEAYTDSQLVNRVVSVNGQTGVVEVTAADLGLSSVLQIQTVLANQAVIEAVPSPSIGDVYQAQDTGYLWAYTNTGWQNIGSTEVDLSSYYTKDEINSSLMLDMSQIVGLDAALAKAKQGAVKWNIDYSSEVIKYNTPTQYTTPGAWKQVYSETATADGLYTFYVEHANPGTQSGSNIRINGKDVGVVSSRVTPADTTINDMFVARAFASVGDVVTFWVFNTVAETVSTCFARFYPIVYEEVPSRLVSEAVLTPWIDYDDRVILYSQDVTLTATAWKVVFTGVAAQDALITGRGLFNNSGAFGVALFINDRMIAYDYESLSANGQRDVTISALVSVGDAIKFQVYAPANVTVSPTVAQYPLKYRDVTLQYPAVMESTTTGQLTANPLPAGEIRYVSDSGTIAVGTSGATNVLDLTAYAKESELQDHVDGDVVRWNQIYSDLGTRISALELQVQTLSMGIDNKRLDSTNKLDIEATSGNAGGYVVPSGLGGQIQYSAYIYLLVGTGHVEVNGVAIYDNRGLDVGLGGTAGALDVQPGDVITSGGMTSLYYVPYVAGV